IRIDDHLLVASHVLLQAGALNVLELHHDHPRVGPFAEFVEADIADDRLERVLVEIVGELVVVERACRLDRLLQDLHRGVSERRLIETERVDAGVFRPRLILLQEILDAGKTHLRARNEEVVVHDTVELLGQLPNQRGILHTDAAPPKSCVRRPISVAARTIPTESGGYDASRTTSGFVAWMARTIGE